MNNYKAKGDKYMKIRNIILFITFILAAQTSTSFAMQSFAIKAAKLGISGACSAAELLITSGRLIGAIYLDHAAKIYTKELQDVQSDAPQIITDYISDIAKERNINNVRVILNDDYDYSANSYTNIIHVPKPMASELELLLNNKNRNLEEEKQLNEHIGTIHHELTHIVRHSKKYCLFYDTIIGTTGAMASTMTLSHIIKKNIPIISKNFILNNGFKVARALCTLQMSRYLTDMNLHGKYDELKADDGIPNKKELLEAQTAFYRNRHEQMLQSVNFVKENDYKTICEEFYASPSRIQYLAIKTIPQKWFNNPLVTDTVFNMYSSHPSNLRRALRFEKRLNNLEKELTHTNNA
jgi:hypothetical protein